MTLRTVRGYAVPFSLIIRFEGVFEHFAPGAFDELLRAGRRIAINAFFHDSAEIACCRSNIDLFTDDYGLGFQAKIDCSDRSLVRAIASDMHCASVGGLKIIDAAWGEFDGLPHRAINRAEISEITICSNAAYQDTRVWFGDCPDELPATLRGLDARWTAGRNAFRERAQQAAMAKQALSADALAFRNNTHSDFHAKAVAHVLATGKSLIFCHSDKATQSHA